MLRRKGESQKKGLNVFLRIKIISNWVIGIFVFSVGSLLIPKNTL